MKNGKHQILITGASGFLGSHLIRGLEKENTITGTYLRHRDGLPPCNAISLDISDPLMVQQHLNQRNDDVIIHAAAITNPDECDKDREIALRTNVEGTGNLAEIAQEHGALFIYISTDLVFDGDEGDYTESDPVSPCNFYAETKRQAEEVVRSRCEKWIILRPALMYGWGNSVSRSFIDWLYGKLREGEEAGLFRDQFRSFLYVEDVARGIQRLINHKIQNEILHVGGPDRLSRYEFGIKFIESFGYSPDLLRPIRMEDLQGYAPRGKDCSLCSDRIKAFGFEPRTVMEGLAAMSRVKQNSR
jgi:dTDP-4-dehydrorhamnose reductase